MVGSILFEWDVWTKTFQTDFLGSVVGTHWQCAVSDPVEATILS